MLKKLLPECFISLNDKNNLATIVHYATILSIGVFIPYYLFIGIQFMYITDSIMVLTLLLISIFFRRGQYFIGKTLNLTATTIYLFILTFIFIDYKTNTNLFFFLLIIVSLTIVDYNEVRERYMAVFFTIANLILVFASEMIYLRPLFYLPEKSIHILSVSNTAIFGLLLAVIFYFYNYSIVKYQRELNQFATTDPLTGILNKRVFFTQGQKVFRDAKNKQTSFSILLFDIDYFKSINDRFGHPAGDRVLIDLTKLISSQIESDDLFARYGGEEFIIISKGQTGIKPIEIAENLRQKIESQLFEVSKDTNIKITVSIGICCFLEGNGHHCTSLETMLQAADHALYEAKKQGRNQCVCT